LIVTVINSITSKRYKENVTNIEQSAFKICPGLTLVTRKRIFNGIGRALEVRNNN
jgi:hypothetical protein